MQQTKYARKLDQTGRMMIPIRLREEMNMIAGKTYPFCTLVENGRNYICIDCGPVEDAVTVEEALEIIRRAGLKVAGEDSENQD